MRQYIADAFAEELFTGNPAAVLPCKQMPEAALMQSVAIENNYSETAFVVKTGSGPMTCGGLPPAGRLTSAATLLWRRPTSSVSLWSPAFRRCAFRP